MIRSRVRPITPLTPLTGAALAVSVLAAGCGPAMPGFAPSPTLRATDGAAPAILQGTVAVVGAPPVSRVVLQTEDGEQVILQGAEAVRLGRMDGLDVRCEGRRDGDRLHVSGFRVTGARGLPAADGVLSVDGDAAVLTLADGRRLRFAPAPPSLREWAGARVWIAGTPGGAPEAWGLIDTP